MPSIDVIDSVVSTRDALAGRLLAIADTKVVLGNWHVACLFNGKSLPDYAALLAMAGASFGHARALYDHLASPPQDFAWLERGRDATQFHSMALLDEAPRDWQDFIVTLHLAEQATWLHASGFVDVPDRPLAALARRIGEEAYFHLTYAQGWFIEFARSAPLARRAAEALERRWPRALAWFADAGESTQADRLREALRDAVLGAWAPIGGDAELGAALTAALAQPPERSVHAAHAPHRRGVAVPPRLFERIRFKDPEAAP